MTNTSPRNFGLLRSFMNACTASRQRQAERHIAPLLLMLDDTALPARGIDGQGLARRKGSIRP